jgi:hypothetical protein
MLQGIEVGKDLGHGLIPALRVLLEAPIHDRKERTRRVRAQRGKRRRPGLQDRLDVRALVGRPEGRPAREHLVQDAAERPHVRPVIRREPLDLLGRHVRQGAGHRGRVRAVR